QVIQPLLMALQAGFDLAQAGGARKLGIQQRHQLTLRCQPAYTAIGTVRLHQPFELAPRQVLQNFMKDAIVMPHGAEPLLLSRNVCRRPRPSRINAMHPVHENSNRTDSRVSAAVMTDVPPMVKWTAAVVAGGGIAGLTQGVTAMLRAHSTVLTGGLGNAVIA